MDFFESITPLLLLIVWAILAAVANQKKKQARREQAPTNPQTGKPVQPPNQDENPVETLMEKLRRGLEEISEEGTTQPLGDPRSDTREPKRRTSPPPIPESTEERMRRAEELQGDKRKQLRRREKPKYTGASEYAPIETLTPTQKSATTIPAVSDAYSIAADVRKRLPSSDLQQGIIWMEILQPPVSLRD